MNNNPYRYEPLYTPGTYTSNVIDSASGEFDIKAPEHTLQEPTSFEPTMLEPTNNAFIPIVDDGEDSSFTRIKGLQAYVTADMKPERERESNRIFGNVLKYAHDHYSNMYVGRAIASAAGVADSPELLFKNPAYAAQGYKLPNAWSDRNQLYAAIGSQFATMEREKMQRTLTEEQAILKEREKDPKALSQAILNAVTRSSVSPADRVMLEYNGITPQTIQKVHAALVLFGQQADNATRHTKTKGTTFAEDKSAEQTTESDIDSSLITGGREGWFGENIVNPYSAYNVADLLGDDKMARGLFLELVAMAGRNKRSQEQGREWSTAGKTLLNETVARLGYALDEWFMTKPDVPAGADADIINDRRNAMLADIRKYYEAGYADTDNRIGFSLARVPVSVARVAGGTIGYLHPAGWIAEASDMGQKSIDEAAANIYNTDPTNMEASWWERKGAAGAKTAVFTGAIIATGGLAKWAGGALSSRFAPELTKRVAGSKVLSYGARVAEGTITEALEELNNAIGQEFLEGVGLIADRQKQENMTQLWKTWTSPEFWSANVGMNLLFGMTGYKGSRSKAPYKSVESLVKLGFSKQEAQSVTDRIQTAIGEGQSQAEVSAILAEEIRKKSLENPQATGKNMIQAAIDMFRRREIEDSAANGVREALLKEANVTDYTKDEDGNYTLKAVKHGADGKFESVEMKLSEDELNNWLTTEAATHITQEILRVQALVRGEQAATAAAKLIAEGKSPFERVAYLTDAPVEVLAKLKGKDTFDAETIAAFTKYAVDEINRRIAGGETRKDAENAEFGTTGATLGTISRLSDQYSEREGIEVHSGNIEEGALTESAAFILPGKSVGDNILMLARGQVTASEVAHDWLEGFARSRFYSDSELWSNRLDALDRELLQRGVIQKSLFKSPEGSRKDIEYIEALNHLTEQRWLVDHEAFNMTDASNALLSEMLEELSAVQNGLALAGELKNWMDSDDGRAALADKGALHKLFAEAGSSLSDLMAEAEQVAPKTAADFVLKHRERMLRELDELANLVESPQAEAPPPTDSDVTLPNGETVTAAEIASVNGIDPSTGELSTPPITAYTSVKATKGAGLGLNGGIAHRMRDGSVEGASKLSTLNLHASVADADLAKANGSISDPVIVYRHRDGKMEVIGGFARYHHDKSLGVENTHVKVFGAGKKHPANWAADKARANKIKEGIASVADIIRHMQKHGYTRNAARKLNLIPKLTTGEHPASRAAWLLMQHATKKELKNLLAGHITTREALATIADKVDTLDLEQQGQATASFSMRQAPAKPISATDAQKEQLFDSDGVMQAANAIVTTPTASFSIRAMHVSPHKFRKFSTDFMGSGEGAQAYGWGLYFMTNEDINKHYWRQFKKVGNKTYYDEGVEISKDEMLDILTRHFSFSFDKKIAASLARHLTNSASHSLADAVADMKENAHRWCDNYDEERDLRNALDSLIEFGDLDFKADVSYPSNYRVELNVDDTNLLMWDEPVSDVIQSEIDAMQRQPDPDEMAAVFAEMKELGISSDAPLRVNWTGEQVYNDLVRNLGSPKAASMWLAEHGIKGIKYLDGGSRAAGEGTYNYVIFSGDDIKITEVNESGAWSMDEGWEPYTDPTASFSMRSKVAYTPEMKQIKEAAEKNGTFMKAPNGEPTNLNEHQWLQVRTKAFKNWFGDWENDPANASKVVDKNGEPKVVYHGARHAGFRVFDNEEGTRMSNAPDGTSFFSSAAEVAYSYSGRWESPDLLDEELQEEIEEYGIDDFDAGIYEVFLNIRDPHYIDFKGKNWDDGDFAVLIDERGDYVYPLNGDEYYESEESAHQRAKELGLENYEVYQEYKNTNIVAQEGMEMGADGVIIENVIDEGSYGAGHAATDYVIFDSRQVKSATQNRGSFDGSNPDITFSIRTKGKRKYSTLDQLHNNELLRMFLDEALQLQQESIRFLDRDSNINDVTRTAAEIRGLLAAMYKVIPKDARPWKTLKDLPERVRTLSYAALNPHEQLDVQNAPGMHPDEVIRYNQLTVDQRMRDIASKLARASTALIKAMARSTEAYLCRAEIERADKAIRALEPKLQKSGKERRGLTSHIVYKKAHQWYKMMDWSDQRIQEEAQKAMAVKANPKATQEDIDEAERTLKAILLFGGLRRENLERTRTGVQFFLDFISTGRATWEAKLTAERRAIEAPQIALANLLPKVDQSYLNNKDRKASLVGKAMEGNMNITQLLDAGSAMQGPIGKFFADWRDQMALALDAANYDIQQEQRNLEKVLSEILQRNGKKGNDIDRSQFIADCQQVNDTGAVREGVIKVTRYEFEAKDIEDFAKIREEQGEEAFKAAVHTRYKSANTKEDLRKDDMPYEAAWQDALSQAQSPYYRGGKIYVDHYGPRDTDHVAPLKLTRMQAANLVMMADQPSYSNIYDDDGKLIKRGTMDINGYTDGVIARLEAYAGRDLMKLARYMRDTYNHTGLFDAYAEYMGLPFPAEPNYWPGMFDQPTSGQMVDALDASRSGNGVFDMLIKRREHISPPDIKLGLYDVWSNTIQQHYNYVHLSPLTRKLRRFLRDRDTYARMCDAVGKSAVDNMIALLDTVDGASGLQLRAQHAWNKLMGWFQGKQALLLLSGATSSAIKQTSGILNALAADGITPLNIIPYIIKSVGFGHKTPADMMKLKVFQNRIDRDSLTNRAFRLEPDQKMGKWGLDMGTVLGMRWFMERPDAWFNSISMAAVYNQTYDSLANAIKATEGHSGTLSTEEIAEIEKQCEAKVSQVMHRAAQPMEKTDKGAVMQQNNAAVSHIFYMAGESLVKVGLVMNRVRKEQAKHAGEPPASRKMQFLRSAFTAWRTLLPFSCANQLLLTLLAAANGSMPDDDEERIQWLASQSIAAITGFGILNIVPVLGDIVSAAGQWAFGSYGAFATFGDSGIGIDPKIGKQINDALEKDGWERIYAIANLTRSIGTVAGMGASKGITGMATGYAILSGIGTLFNAARPIIQRFRNNERDEKKKSKKKSPLIIPT